MKALFIKEDKPSGKNNFVSRLQDQFVKSNIEVTNNINEKHDVSLHLVYVNSSVKSKKVLRLNGVNHNTAIEYQDWNKGISNSIQQSDGIVYQSEFSKIMCDKYLEGNKPFRIIANGAPVDFYKDIPPHESDYKYNFITASRRRPHKRLRDIIESFLEFNNKDSCLWIAGDIRLSGLSKKEIQRYMSIENIAFIGTLDERTLGSYYKLCDACIHICWLDCCPNTVIESCVAGCPVITNNVGGTREIIEKCGGIVCDIDQEYNLEPVDLYNPPKIDRSIICRSMDRVLSKKIKINKYKFDISNIARKYIEFFTYMDSQK